jgi:hypothetical protein
MNENEIDGIEPTLSFLCAFLRPGDLAHLRQNPALQRENHAKQTLCPRSEPSPPPQTPLFGLCLCLAIGRATDPPCIVAKI